MGGDHKCPVCQATFTRPQHVARHMRSHTGDRPYKCQYCGDQFARSDLLSRHVNKCHAGEKPLPPAPGGRRKGPASASRATTSKQACDQCVQSSLPCDGCNPCAKCVQRKCRCTFVKFHRQTAPSGPGHTVPPTLSSSLTSSLSSLSSLSATRLPSRYPYPNATTADEFVLAPPPASGGLGGVVFNEFSFPPLYDAPVNVNTTVGAAGEPGDFAAKYRAQAELLRLGSTGTGGVTGMYSSSNTTNPADPRWAQGAGGWDGYAHQQAPPLHHHGHGHGHHQTQAHAGHGGHAHAEKHPSNVSLFSTASSSSSTTASSSSSNPLPVSFPTYRKSLDLDYAGGLDGIYARHPYLHHGGGHQGGGGELEFSSSDGGSSVPSSATSSSVHLPLAGGQGEDGRPSSSYSQQSHHASAQSQQQGQQQSNTTSDFHSAFGLMSLDDPAVLAGLSTDAAPFFSLPGAGSGDPDATPMPPSNDGAKQPEDRDDVKEDFWRAFMRTPLSGPGAPASANTTANGRGQRQRVASLPSVKTPGPVGIDLSRTAHEDDLKSYEAAVMARKAPVQLTFQPRLRRNHPNGTQAQGQGSASVGSSPQVPIARFSHPQAQAQQGTSSSLAGVFGRPPQAPSSHYRQQQGQGQGSDSASPRETSLDTDESNSSGSPASLLHDSSNSMTSIKEEDSRPSFKRLPSQTLGPSNSKRAFLGHEDGGEERGWAYPEELEEQGQGLREEKKPFAVISGSIAERRRRMSAPATEVGGVGFAPVGQGA